ncbi:hypothetical protein ECP03052936_4955, partial [Escherichia coli p0305293.6]
MCASLPFVGIPLSFAQLFRNMVQQLAITTVNGGMIR